MLSTSFVCARLSLPWRALPIAQTLFLVKGSLETIVSVEIKLLAKEETSSRHSVVCIEWFQDGCQYVLFFERNVFSVSLSACFHSS